VPAAVAERVELLHVAELQPRLLLHPTAQTGFERAVRKRIEGAERQRIGAVAMHDQHAGTFLGNRYDGCRQSDQHSVEVAGGLFVPCR
jgi:hypothetical protein